MVLDDLIGEGNLGLIRAAEEYDPRFGTRFSTYASYWIKQAIRHALINTTATIRLPAHMVDLLTKWRRAERALTRELGCAADGRAGRRRPRPDRRADGAWSSKAQRASQLRLESGGGEDGGDWSPDEASDDRRRARRGARGRRRAAATCSAGCERLDDRERPILALRFGLEGELPLTLKEVGRRLGVTREWVRKIEIRAVRKLDDASPDDPTADAASDRRPGRPRYRRRPTQPGPVAARQREPDAASDRDAAAGVDRSIAGTPAESHRAGVASAVRSPRSPDALPDAGLDHNPRPIGGDRARSPGTGESARMPDRRLDAGS